MSLSHRYRRLAAFIEALESHGITVREAEPACDGDDSGSSDTFAVQLCVELPADATVSRLGRESVDRAAVSEQPPNEPVGVHTSSPVEGQTGERGDGLEDDGAVGAIEGVETAGAVDTADPTETDTDADATGAEDPADSEAEHVETSDAPATDDEATADAVHVADEDTRSEADEDTRSEADEDTGSDADEDAGNDAPTDEGGVPCTHTACDRTFDTERGMKIHRTKAHPLSELADQAADRTVHHDPEVLARVYDEYETFAEMTEALDVDVGAQAVRKQMIRHGIHEPSGSASSRVEEDDPASESDGSDSHDADDTSARTDSLSRTGAGPGDPPSATEIDTDVQSETIADRLPALDLPESLSTHDLQTAVEEATTLFDVQRALDLDQQTTRDVLSEYDLLELVSGRAASLRDREELKDEIGQRIRRTAT